MAKKKKIKDEWPPEYHEAKGRMEVLEWLVGECAIDESFLAYRLEEMFQNRKNY